MEKCPHLEKLTVSSDLSLLDPSKWLCSVCGTTEWVWACLSCAHVACGRLNEKHAVSHYEATKHHIAIEINEKYVYCYTCDDYIMEDNQCGDLEAIRSALTAIGTMSFEGVGRKGGNLLRSFSHQQEISYSHTDEDDRLITAQIHYRKSVLDKVFTAWLDVAQKAKKEKKTQKKMLVSPGSDLGHSEPPPMVTRSRSGLFQFKKRTLIPGVTGLRNLGNTCYINSIIQSLGHLEDFREYFCQLVFDLFSPGNTPLATSSSFSPNKGPLAAARQLLRLNTVDYYQHLNTVPAKKSPGTSKGKKGAGGGRGQKSPSGVHKAGGLNGGRADTTETGDVNDVTTNEAHLMKAKADALNALSLCQELHGLLRVLWSGKWAQVSPHGFLHSVWRAIPVFKGHAQHDAQEFLCELLDKLSQEMEDLPQCKGLDNIVDHSFRGELVSQVTCLSCQNTSRRYEPFLDLSLEFPPLFQQTNSHSLRKMCHLTEMLFKFTEQEDLEPRSYSCDKCNSKRRRSSRQGLGTKTDANKQLLISKPPEILRLHLKRFRWCGRNHREKINTHVAFDNVIDISPFCLDTGTLIPQYRLQAVVVHHGAGFRAGHYTAYTYNNDAGSWVHCNDSRVNLVSEEEVLLSQAYILFYTREMSEVGHNDIPVLTPESSSSLTRQSTISTMPDLDDGSLQTLRRLSRGETEQIIDDDISISFQRDPTLIRQFSSVNSETDLKRAATLDFRGSSPPVSSSSFEKPKRLSPENVKISPRRFTSSHSDSEMQKIIRTYASSKSLSPHSFHKMKTESLIGPEKVNNNTQRLSSLSPDLGMKRASSMAHNFESPSPPGSNKVMKLNNENEAAAKSNFQSCNSTFNSEPSSPQKAHRSPSTENGKSNSLPSDIKTEPVLPPESSSSLPPMPPVQNLKTSKSASALQLQRLNSLFLDLKREATNISSMKSLPSSPSKRNKNLTPQKTTGSPKRQSPLCFNVKRELTLDAKSQPSSPDTKRWTPEKANSSSLQRPPPTRLDLNLSNSQNSSPNKMVTNLANATTSTSPQKLSSHQLSLKREATLKLNLDSPSPSRKTVHSAMPEKASSSPLKQTFICLDSKRKISSSPSKIDKNVTPDKVKNSPKRQSSPLAGLSDDHSSASPKKMIKLATPEKVI